LIIFLIMGPMIRVRVGIGAIEGKTNSRLAAARADNPPVAVGTDNQRRIPVARASAGLRPVWVDRPRLMVMVVMTISRGKPKKAPIADAEGRPCSFPRESHCGGSQVQRVLAPAEGQ
jgi:hypothetical protein